MVEKEPPQFDWLEWVAEAQLEWVAKVKRTELIVLNEESLDKYEAELTEYFGMPRERILKLIETDKLLDFIRHIHLEWYDVGVRARPAAPDLKEEVESAKLDRRERRDAGSQDGPH